MISLEKSEKFQTEYKGYMKKIESIDNMRVKSELQGLMEKLITEVRSIDKQHYQLINTHTLPDITEDSKQRLIETRRKIAKLIGDYEKAKSNT